jgi:hypothetical protein
MRRSRVFVVVAVALVVVVAEVDGAAGRGLLATAVCAATVAVPAFNTVVVVAAAYDAGSTTAVAAAVGTFTLDMIHLEGSLGS